MEGMLKRAKPRLHVNSLVDTVSMTSKDSRARQCQGQAHENQCLCCTGAARGFGDKCRNAATVDALVAPRQLTCPRDRQWKPQSQSCSVRVFQVAQCIVESAAATHRSAATGLLLFRLCRLLTTDYRFLELLVVVVLRVPPCWCHHLNAHSVTCCSVPWVHWQSSHRMIGTRNQCPVSRSSGLAFHRSCPHPID